MRRMPPPIQHGAGDVALVPPSWRLCRRCALEGACTPATHTVPGSKYPDELACEDHAYGQAKVLLDSTTEA